MTPTEAKNVTHYCRICGFEATPRVSRKTGAVVISAHGVAYGHYAVRHPQSIRPVRRCPAGCGLKATYFEKQAGKMQEGAMAARIWNEVVTNNPNMH